VLCFRPRVPLPLAHAHSPSRLPLPCICIRQGAVFVELWRLAALDVYLGSKAPPAAVPPLCEHIHLHFARAVASASASLVHACRGLGVRNEPAQHAHPLQAGRSPRAAQQIAEPPIGQAERRGGGGRDGAPHQFHPA
jgi:hypothetical protein